MNTNYIVVHGNTLSTLVLKCIFLFIEIVYYYFLYDDKVMEK